MSTFPCPVRFVSGLARCGIPRLVPALARSWSRTLRQPPGWPPRSRSWGTRPSPRGIA